MEIQKIYCEVSTDEKLYSVLISEEELALFSEIQKEFNSKNQKALKRALSISQGFGLGKEGVTRKAIEYELKHKNDPVWRKATDRLVKNDRKFISNKDNSGYFFGEYSSWKEQGGTLNDSINRKSYFPYSGMNKYKDDVNFISASASRNANIPRKKPKLNPKTEFGKRSLHNYDHELDYKFRLNSPKEDNKIIMKRRKTGEL